jgi:hypothetical protein
MTLVSLIHFDSVWYALLPPLAYLLCAMIEGNLATPLFLGRWLTLNPIAILLTFLLWSYLWGLPAPCSLFPSWPPLKSSAIELSRSNGWAHFLGDSRYSYDKSTTNRGPSLTSTPATESPLAPNCIAAQVGL